MGNVTTDRSAGVLLTGGASRRLGTDKALISSPSGQPLARHLGALLAAVAAPCVEVGPGRSDLPSVWEDPPGQGPLAAVLAGWDHLGRPDTLLVVAVDQPHLTAELLAFLASHPHAGSVVPVDEGGRPQPLCARYVAADLARAAVALAAGDRSMRELVAGAALLSPAEWRRHAPAGDPFADLDTPEDLATYRDGL